MNNELPIPAFFDLKKANSVWSVDYRARRQDALAWAKKYGLNPASQDLVKICLMEIDNQNTFGLPQFELFVGGRSGDGAIKDAIRLAEFKYRNLAKISKIAVTMDSHLPFMIFDPLLFINDAGDHPADNSPMSSKDLLNGTWKVDPAAAAALGQDYVALQKHAIYYTEDLERRGKYSLFLWTPHGQIMGIGHALMSIIEEAVYFHSVARHIQPTVEVKGLNPLTENYSILRPEVLTTYDNQPIAQKNVKFLQALLKYDYVIIAGQAKSHCVAWTIDDLLTEIQSQDAELAKKVYLLEDCTSPVFIPKSVTGLPNDIDFTDQADAAFVRFAKAGMHLVKSTDPIESWPGIKL